MFLIESELVSYSMFNLKKVEGIYFKVYLLGYWINVTLGIKRSLKLTKKENYILVVTQGEANLIEELKNAHRSN